MFNKILFQGGPVNDTGFKLSKPFTKEELGESIYVDHPDYDQAFKYDYARIDHNGIIFEFINYLPKDEIPVKSITFRGTRNNKN
jgi:hypothetical protein